MKARRLAAALAAIGAFVLSVQAAAAQQEDRYLLLDDEGGKQGDLVVTTDGDRVSLIWERKDNGRGTETKESFRLGSDGLAVEWTIETLTDLGGEGGPGTGSALTRFTRSGNRAEWMVGGKPGDRTVSGPVVFVPREASPWMAGIYAKALLKRGASKLPALPEGEVRLEPRGEESVAGIPLSSYALTLPGRDPVIVRLDRAGRLVALDDGRLVAADRTDVASALRTAAGARSEADYAARQAKLVHSFPGPVRIRNVRVFDPASGTLKAPASVVFHRGRITTIEPLDYRDVKGETVFDGEGGTLIPGLNDTHFHLGLSRAEGAWLSLAAGVTTGRDMGTSITYMQSYLPKIESGRLPGPRILASGLIEGASPFSLQSSGVVVSSEAEAVEAVRRYAGLGYHQIKIYNSVHADWVPAIAREAHRLGLRVAGHIPAFSTAGAMVDAGYDEVTHGNQLMLGWVLKPGEDTRSPLRLTAMSRFADLDLSSPEVIATLDRMQARGTAFEPTLAIMRRLLTNRTGQVEPEDRWWFSHLPEGFKPGTMVTVLPGFTIMPIKTEADDAAYNQAAEKMVELVGLMNRRGIFMPLGSDDNNGFILHRELELFVKAGMTPAQALARATLETATYLGGGADWGSIERGKSADFFLVPGDPTKDIKAAHAVRMTVVQGRVYFPSEIYASFGIAPFVATPRRYDAR